MQMLQFVSMMGQAIFLLVLRKPYPTCLSLVRPTAQCRFLGWFTETLPHLPCQLHAPPALLVASRRARYLHKGPAPAALLVAGPR